MAHGQERVEANLRVGKRDEIIILALCIVAGSGTCDL